MPTPCNYTIGFDIETGELMHYDAPQNAFVAQLPHSKVRMDL